MFYFLFCWILSASCIIEDKIPRWQYDFRLLNSTTDWSQFVMLPHESISQCQFACNLLVAWCTETANRTCFRECEHSDNKSDCFLNCHSKGIDSCIFHLMECREVCNSVGHEVCVNALKKCDEQALNISNYKSDSPNSTEEMLHQIRMCGEKFAFCETHSLIEDEFISNESKICKLQLDSCEVKVLLACNESCANETSASSEKSEEFKNCTRKCNSERMMECLEPYDKCRRDSDMIEVETEHFKKYMQIPPSFTKGGYQQLQDSCEQHCEKVFENCADGCDEECFDICSRYRDESGKSGSNNKECVECLANCMKGCSGKKEYCLIRCKDEEVIQTEEEVCIEQCKSESSKMQTKGTQQCVRMCKKSRYVDSCMGSCVAALLEDNKEWESNCRSDCVRKRNSQQSGRRESNEMAAEDEEQDIAKKISFGDNDDQNEPITWDDVERIRNRNVCLGKCNDTFIDCATQLRTFCHSECEQRFPRSASNDSSSLQFRCIRKCLDLNMRICVDAFADCSAICHDAFAPFSLSRVSDAKANKKNENEESDAVNDYSRRNALSSSFSPSLNRFANEQLLDYPSNLFNEEEQQELKPQNRTVDHKTPHSFSRAVVSHIPSTNASVNEAEDYVTSAVKQCIYNKMSDADVPILSSLDPDAIKKCIRIVSIDQRRVQNRTIFSTEALFESEPSQLNDVQFDGKKKLVFQKVKHDCEEECDEEADECEMNCEREGRRMMAKSGIDEEREGRGGMSLHKRKQKDRISSYVDSCVDGCEHKWRSCLNVCEMKDEKRRKERRRVSPSSLPSYQQAEEDETISDEEIDSSRTKEEEEVKRHYEKCEKKKKRCDNHCRAMKQRCVSRLLSDGMSVSDAVSDCSQAESICYSECEDLFFECFWSRNSTTDKDEDDESQNQELFSRSSDYNYNYPNNLYSSSQSSLYSSLPTDSYPETAYSYPPSSFQTSVMDVSYRPPAQMRRSSLAEEVLGIKKTPARERGEGLQQKGTVSREEAKINEAKMLRRKQWMQKGDEELENRVQEEKKRMRVKIEEELRRNMPKKRGNFYERYPSALNRGISHYPTNRYASLGSPLDEQSRFYQLPQYSPYNNQFPASHEPTYYANNNNYMW
eukprot:MONOS_370.1-p1 / transcript=MONOS_370.1 / gene=MONOS_370 / organism=Monocercomonoides_exilis_PA203 / gene_product=unspecified product / transcript_product=unspecified product / location=Mono_scaffold00006:85867-89799(-) / protein_length=1112 / sequence_SO=supercontig / SO=protein_coding / is_pseudo=false